MAIISPTPELQHHNLVSAEVFAAQPEAAFWLGKVATGPTVENQAYYDGLMQFRGDVYVRQLHFLPEDHLDTLGREIDVDDNRSVQFVVLWHGEESSETAQVVGSTRLIMKSDPAEELPIEHYFPEVFTDGPADVGSGEVSRFIARHPNGPTQQRISRSLIRAAVLYSMKNGIDTQYFMIEEKLVNAFERLKMPLDILGDPKYVPEYEGVLYPVRVSPRELFRNATAGPAGTSALRMYFESAASDDGTGFYDSKMLGVKGEQPSTV